MVNFSAKLCSRVKVTEQAMNFADYFQRDAGICGGETVLKGTRVTVRTVLASLAEGSSFQAILQDYPSLSEEHCPGCRCFCRYVRERGSTNPELARC